MPRLDLDALEAAEKAATKAPWHNGPTTPAGKVWVYAGGDTVGEPDASRTGFRAWFTRAMPTINEFTPIQKMTAKEAESDAVLVAALRNAAPALIARARLAERMAEALRNMVDATEHTYCSPTPEGHIAGESIRRVRDKARAVLREWDALNAEK